MKPSVVAAVEEFCCFRFQVPLVAMVGEYSSPRTSQALDSTMELSLSYSGSVTLLVTVDRRSRRRGEIIKSKRQTVVEIYT